MSEVSARPDALDEIGAFRAGYRHGTNTSKQVSPKEAEEILRSLPTTIPATDRMLEAFCNGCGDGVAGDTTRYLMSFGVA